MARETIDVLNADALRETLEAIREFIKEHRSFKAPGLEPPSIPNDSVVRVTGQPILATTTTTPAPTSTSSTTSTTSTTTPGPTYLWPGKYLIRDFSTTIPSEKWREIADIYIEEVNGFELEVGKNYPAEYIGQYGGLAVFGVESIEDTVEAGSGSGPCAGVLISDLIRCTDDGLEIRDGCLTIIDGQIVLIPDTTSSLFTPQEPTIIVQPQGGGSGPIGPTIGWEAMTGAIGYSIEHSTDGVDWANEDVTDQTAYDSAVFTEDGTTHFWRVKAIYEGGVSEPSLEVFAQVRRTTGDLTWPAMTLSGQIELYGQGGDGSAGGGGGGGSYAIKEVGGLPSGTVAITFTPATSVSGAGMTAGAGTDAGGSPGTGGVATGGDTNINGGDGDAPAGGEGGGPAGGNGGGANTNGEDYSGGGGGTTGIGAGGAAILSGIRWEL